jgi:methyltransferase (TIGR00027 family)
MEERKPSLSAEIDAVIRSIETNKPESERLCYDPFAKNLISKTTKIIGKIPPLRKLALWYVERKHPFMFDCIPARTRYVDEYVNSCVDAGIQQLVNLGAGYDSRAYRLDKLKEHVRVFEVDHPATQGLKVDKIKKILGSIPSNVIYVPMDFNKENLREKLFHSGYEKDKKTLFIWEGVTPYLTAEAVYETLNFVANNSGPESSIIFTYILQSVVDGKCELEAAKTIKTIRKAFDYEGLKFGLEKENIEEFLSNRGFHGIKDVSGDFYTSEYFKGPNRNRKGCCLCRVVTATVKSPV